MFCLAPVILLAYALTMQTAAGTNSNVNGYVAEVQTCSRGLGIDVKASTAGLYGLGLQYGIPIVTVHGVTLTVLPKAGLSGSSEPRRELPMGGQFEVGAQALLEYHKFVIGLEYWHLSNGGLKSPNIGLDLLLFQTGYKF